MTDEHRDDLIRRYARLELTWRDLQARGFRDDVEVLAALGERGLRPPVAPMEGHSAAARERGRAWLREELADAAR